jgi:nitrogen regulatory protein P-II 2
MLKNRKLLTIVLEAALEARLIKEVRALGVKGYTISSARGAGPKNQRNGDLEGGNIRMEIVCGEELLEQLIELISTQYLPSYACSFWVSEVSVLREERY